MVGEGTEQEMDKLEDQVQEVALLGGEWGGDLLCFCKTCY